MYSLYAFEVRLLTIEKVNPMNIKIIVVRIFLWLVFEECIETLLLVTLT